MSDQPICYVGAHGKLQLLLCWLSVFYSAESAEENKKGKPTIFNGKKISKIRFHPLFTHGKQKCGLFREKEWVIFLARYLFWKVRITLLKEPLEKSCSALDFQSQSITTKK